MNFKNYTLNSNKSANQTTKKNDEVNSVAVEEREHSLLDLSYSHKTTFNVGDVVPIFQLEAFPGDNFSIDVNTLLKMSIPNAPTMDSPRYDINFFFVPWKQVFPKFSEIIGTEYSGGSPEPAETIPTIQYGNNSSFGVNDLASHMEIPINVDMSKIGFNISALPFRAYIKICDEWYRDENLVSEIDYTNNQDINNATVDASNYWNTSNNMQVGQGLFKSARLRDYFASCLPFIQKGEIPTISTITPQALQNMFNDVSISQIPVVDSQGNTNISFTFGEQTLHTQNATNKLNFNGNGLGNITITELRNAIVQQHQNELDARAGTRYYEKLLSYWGVSVNPLEINRTEFLGGWHNQININNVVQSAPQTSSANTPLGTLGALSITTGQLPKTIRYSVSQYGIILGLITVRTNITYSQGLPKLFTKVNNWDFYNPTFNGISEQPIYKYELYLSENASNNMAIFGYNQPFADLKYKPNVASGYLSCNATDTYYNFYTYQDNLSSTPTLSNQWITYPRNALENTLLMNSSNQSENINDFLADFYYDVKVSRKIPAYSIPGVDKI